GRGRERRHRGQRPGGLHRRAVHRAREPAAAGHRGVPVGRPAAADHRGRELPRVRRGHHGPAAHDGHARPGGALRRALRHRPGHAARPGGRARRHPQGVGGRRGPRDAHRRAGHGGRAPQARRPGRGRALRPRRLLLRHLRRRLLQGEADRRGRRRRLRHGGGHLPGQVRVQGHGDPPPRRVPRVEDHVRAGQAGAEHRDPDPVRRRGLRGHPAARGRAPAQHADGRGARGRGVRRVRRHRPRAAVGDRRGPGADGRRRLRRHGGPLDPHGPAGRLRGGRPRGPHVPPGHHRGRIGLSGGPRRGVVPARHAGDPDAPVARRRRPRAGPVGQAGRVGRHHHHL
ncbi:MAG: Thioredoxin reductase, partial [uncultured Solirubrobacteraceae bacterium]